MYLGRERSASHQGPELQLTQRPDTFAQTQTVHPHFSLATRRRTIHSVLPVTRPEPLYLLHLIAALPGFDECIGDFATTMRYLAQCPDYRTHIQKPLSCFTEPGLRVKDRFL